MYTFNLFVYGHKMSVNKDLNNQISDFDLYCSKFINGKKFEIYCPYHGGQILGDVYSVVFGTIITDDDNNSNLITEIQNFKKEDYEKDYVEYLDFVKKDLIDNKSVVDGEECKEYNLFVDKLIDFLNNTKPQFYQVEASS
mgnify:CR=1 FL=1